LAAYDEDEQRGKARAMIRQFAVDGQVDVAAQLFRRLGAALDDREFARERECWMALAGAEAAFARWKACEGPAAGAAVALESVLRFPSGWMRLCDGVEEAVGRQCVPLVARRLHEVLMAENRNEEALGIAAMICDSRKLLNTYFTRDTLKQFLILCKGSAREILSSTGRL